MKKDSVLKEKYINESKIWKNVLITFMCVRKDVLFIFFALEVTFISYKMNMITDPLTSKK